jgi:hypothetical protein
LQRSIAAAKIRRIHDGSAAREAAQHAFLSAPGILNGIMNDTSASARHRIESIRELRQISANEPTDGQKADKEKFHIVLNFGTAKVVKDVEVKPKQETLTIEHSEDEEREEFGF